MKEDEFDDIFKKGSKTYFNSSSFFPKVVRKNVSILYAFVRTADNFVDSIPQNKKGFLKFKKEFYLARKGKKVDNKIIENFILLEKNMGFEKEWAEFFLNSMELDLTKKNYKNITEVLEYIHGSAEVIGLFMVKILGLNDNAQKNAMLLGRAMQYINFIRDIDEDSILGRNYFPENELKKYGLKSLNKEDALNNVNGFRKFVREQIKYYKNWNEEAREGFVYIPREERIAIKTAADMYDWTAKIIEKNPEIVYEKQVKPSKLRIYFTALINRVIT
jgi:15-cis-phytoene synthase